MNIKDKTVVIYGSKRDGIREHILNVTADEYKAVKKGSSSLIARTKETIQKGDVIKFQVMHFSFDQLHQKNWYLVPGLWEVKDIAQSNGSETITLSLQKAIEL
jgi:DNA-directed RNA polymerase subunit E'/Rpb7